MARITINTRGGQVRNLYSVANAAGAATAVYSDAALTTAVTLPKSIVADTTFYLNDGPVDVVIKTLGGQTIFSDRVLAGHNDEVVLSPVPTMDQTQLELNSGYDSEPEAYWNNFLMTSADIFGCGNTTFHPASGSVLLVKMRNPRPQYISTVGFVLTSGIVTPVAGQNFMGLYTVSGTTATRIGVTADVGTTAFQTLGLGAANLTAPAWCEPGWVYAAMLPNGATMPALVAGAGLSPGNVSVANVGLTAATARVLIGPTAQTTLPASIDLSAQSMNVPASFWAGVK